jgi:hypothetical protein
MPRGASPKRERQYEHIKDSAEQRGESPKRATEIAARTVNKERARAGVAHRQQDVDPGHLLQPARRPASHSGAAGRTKDQLYAEARKPTSRAARR